MKRLGTIKVLIAGILVISALIPVLYPLDDDFLREDSPIYRAYSLQFASITTFYDSGIQLFWTTALAPAKTVLTLPSSLPTTAETRAPPA